MLAPRKQKSIGCHQHKDGNHQHKRGDANELLLSHGAIQSDINFQDDRNMPIAGREAVAMHPAYKAPDRYILTRRPRRRQPLSRKLFSAKGIHSHPCLLSEMRIVPLDPDLTAIPPVVGDYDGGFSSSRTRDCQCGTHLIDRKRQ